MNWRLYVLFGLLIFGLAGISAQLEANASQDAATSHVLPAIDGGLIVEGSFGHSHNDYWQTQPLVDALEADMLSIEVDVFLKDGELYVAHDPHEIRADRTLRSMYLNPLKQAYQQHGGVQADQPFRGRVRASGLPVVLMVDFKTDGRETWPVLEQQLSAYEGLIREVIIDDGGETRVLEGPVIVVCSGSRPIEMIADAKHRRSAIDGRLPAGYDSDMPGHLMPMVSTSMGTLKDIENIESDAQLSAALQRFANAARRDHRLARVYAAPDEQAYWQSARKAGMQLINTDHPRKLAAFLDRGTQVDGDELDTLIKSALERAADNADEIQNALDRVPPDQRPGMRFLVAYMPEHDLQTLTADYLLSNVELAYQAKSQALWGDQIPEKIFFNDVLPYASVNERRDDWRADFLERFGPLVAEAQSPGEAAVILNQSIYDMVGVEFSRKRPKADQSALESIEAGMASCTGMSILLIDACRAVGVPARLAGIAKWPKQAGNHSWVEVWDQQWHFTGAGEPQGDQLNRGWFVERAGTARGDERMHAIYASSYQPTGITFPLVWAPDNNTVPAVNVTHRYAMDNQPSAGVAEQPVQDIEASMHALAQLKQYLAMPRSERAPINTQVFADVPLTREDAAEARRLLWENHAAMIRDARAGEMETRVLVHGNSTMPFFYRVVGEKPEDGRSLYISLHGGGETDKSINDQQWENQKQLYEIDEGVYVAPRSPTDTWNMWHRSDMDGLYDRLIENMIVFEDVNPNRVYLMGYSAGGDGVYQVAPRMADRFAAAAMMAGHPNESKPLGLRNLPFTIHVGEADVAYDRNKIAMDWARRLAELRRADPQGYQHWVKIHKDKGHWMEREDAAALPWMTRFSRDPFPDRIVWRQDDVTHSRFYWLAIPDEQQEAGNIVIATRHGQHIDIISSDVDTLLVRLSDQMLDMDKPIVISSGGRTLFEGRANRTIAMLARSLAERGDSASMFAGQVIVELPQDAQPNE